jgi:hypothetical protein
MLTEKRPTFVATLNPTFPDAMIFCLRDVDKNLGCRWQDPAGPASYVCEGI